MTTDPLTQILSGAVSPMLVISAAGLLLLSMTNRYARVIDRVRAYRKQWATLPEGSEEADATQADLLLMWRRARLLRLSITLATVSILGVVLTVFGLFLHLLSAFNAGTVVLSLFGCSLAALAGSLVVFLRDLTLSLHALEHEVTEDKALVMKRER